MTEQFISPYTFCKLKDGNYFLIIEVVQRRGASELIKDTICVGAFLSKDKVVFDLQNDVINKNKLIIKSANFKKIEQFLFDNSIHKENWIKLSEISAFIKREPIIFKIPSELNLNYI